MKKLVDFVGMKREEEKEEREVRSRGERRGEEGWSVR